MIGHYAGIESSCLHDPRQARVENFQWTPRAPKKLLTTGKYIATGRHTRQTADEVIIEHKCFLGEGIKCRCLARCC